jgi:hypothetical protein
MQTTKSYIPMEHYGLDKLIAICSGVVGGMLMFVNTYLLDATFALSLTKAAITAFVCGLAGVASKHFFTAAKAWYLKRKRKNRKNIY